MKGNKWVIESHYIFIYAVKIINITSNCEYKAVSLRKGTQFKLEAKEKLVRRHHDKYEDNPANRGERKVS